MSEQESVQEPMGYPFKHGDVRIVCKGHATGLLNHLAKWMRREKVGDYQTLELVAAYVDVLEATPPAAQRQWVGLTVAEMEELTLLVGRMDYTRMLQLAETKLKEKNT